jgi:hypothetical protein
MSSDPFPHDPKPRLLRLSVETWVVLALVVGAAPWVAMTLELLRDCLRP